MRHIQGNLEKLGQKMNLENLKVFEKKLIDRYLKSVCDLYIVYSKRRGDTHNTTKIVRWIRSTVQKDSFAFCLIKAKLVRQPYTVSEIADEISISRQSASDMVKTCVAEGWVDIFCDEKQIEEKDIKYCKSAIKYCAGDEMMAVGYDYVHRHIQQTDATFMNSNWDDLMALRRVIKALQ